MDEHEQRYREAIRRARRYFLVSFGLALLAMVFATLSMVHHPRWLALSLVCCAVSLAMSWRQTRRRRAAERARAAEVAGWQEARCA